MKKINLQGPCLLYHSNLFVEVFDEIAAALAEAECTEQNYVRRVYQNKVYLSLDAEDSIEHEALFVTLPPCELYECKVMAQKLRAALNVPPDTQGRRVYVHHIPGLSKTEITQAEGVARSRVPESIEHGLRNMEKLLKNTFWQAEQSLGKSHGYWEG